MRDDFKKLGISLSPLSIEREENLLLQDENLIKEIAELYNTKSNLFALIIKNRLNKNGDYILYDCPDYELEARRLVLRELSKLITDLQEISSEYDRIKAKIGMTTNYTNSMKEASSEDIKVEESSV